MLGANVWAGNFQIQGLLPGEDPRSTKPVVSRAMAEISELNTERGKEVLIGLPARVLMY